MQFKYIKELWSFWLHLSNNKLLFNIYGENMNVEEIEKYLEENFDKLPEGCKQCVKGEN